MNTIPQIPRGGAGPRFGWHRLAFCLVVLTAATAAFAGSDIPSIVVFGDSISDTGRLYQLTHGGFPPKAAYHEGRQTNGSVWVEYLADWLGLDHHLKNYAVVGAMTGPSAAIPTGNVWSDTFTGLEGTSVSGQFAHFLADSARRPDPEALYIIEGGANDLITPLSALLQHPPATTEEFMQDVQAIAMPTVVNIATIAGTLKAMGMEHIAVVNVPDFGKTPRLVNFGPVASATVSMVVAFVNEAVAAQLDAIDAGGGVKIARIDLYGFVDHVVANPNRFGFTNVTGQFMTLDLPTLTVTYASTKHLAAAHWFFWDDLHPSTLGHKYFAQSALVTLRAAFPTLRHMHDDADLGNHDQ